MLISIGIGLLDWLSNPLGSAISAIGGAISNAQQAKENQKNREWNEYMWNLNNEYNKPINVMNRFDEAGLNRNLIYSSGTGAGSLSSYAGNLGTDNSYKNPLQGVNPLQDYISVNSMKNENKKVASDIEVNDSIIEKNRADAKKANTSAELDKANTDYRNVENKYIENEKIINLAIQGKDKELKDLLVDYQKEANPQMVAKLREEVSNLEKEGAIKDSTKNLIDEQTRTQAAETKYVLAKSDTERKQQQVLAAQVGYYGALTYQAQTQAQLNLAVKDNTEWMTTRIRFLTPTEKLKMQSEIINNRAIFDKIKSETGVNNATILGILNTIVDRDRRYSLDYWQTYVRDHYGDGVWNRIISGIFNDFCSIYQNMLPQGPYQH